MYSTSNEIYWNFHHAHSKWRVAVAVHIFSLYVYIQAQKIKQKESAELQEWTGASLHNFVN